MKTTFTKEELYEIEKQFDVIANICAHKTGETVMHMAQLPTKSETRDKFANKIIEEGAHTYDVYRTISAKASKMRE